MNSRMKFTTTAIVALLSAIFLIPTAGAGQVIDRIVARVNGRIILQSELDEAVSYEAVLNGKPFNQFAADERRAVLGKQDASVVRVGHQRRIIGGIQARRQHAGHFAIGHLGIA